MKNEKVQFKFFSIPQWKEEQEYLQNQHKNGWRFTKVTAPGMYHFEKCEPEDVVYQLDYNPEGLEHKDEYVQMFADCGWEYLQDYVGYIYFRKPASQMNGDEEIFCDDVSRLDMMNRVFKGRMIPLIAIFLGIIIPQFISQLINDDPLANALTWFFVAIGLMYLIIMVQFGIKYYKVWKDMKK